MTDRSAVEAPGPIRVAVCEPQTLLRQALCARLAQEPLLRIVACWASPQEITAAAAVAPPPHVIVAELHCEGGSLGDHLPDLRLRLPGVRWIGITTHRDDALLGELAALGLYGIVHRDQPYGVLRDAILQAYRDPARVSAELARLAEASTVDAQPADPSQALTDREKEVLRLVMQGKENREIADELAISASTVHSHLAVIYDKLGAHNRTSAVVAALRRGAVRGESETG